MKRNRVYFVSFLSLLIILGSVHLSSATRTHDFFDKVYQISKFANGSVGTPGIETIPLDAVMLSDPSKSISFELTNKATFGKTFYLHCNGVMFAVEIIRYQNKRLNVSDLRIGQKFILHQLKTSNPRSKDEVELELLEYSPPAKALRLFVNASIKEVPHLISTEEVSHIIYTYLSWLLTSQYYFIPPNGSESTNAIIGDVRVEFNRSDTTTGWQFRSVATTETLIITCNLLDQNTSSSWARILSKGGSAPGKSNEITDLNAKSVFKDIPQFELKKL
jgi:hypothetical protein